MSEVQTIANPIVSRGTPSEPTNIRRVLNTRLLVATLIIGGVLSLLSFAWYRYRIQQVASTLSQRAVTLEAANDWRAAASYWNRYLQLTPDDADARIRLVTAAEKSVRSVGQRRSLVSLLYETVGRLPDQHDLQLKLANQLLLLGDAVAAETEAAKVDPADAPGQLLKARIIAQAKCARARSDNPASIQDAATSIVAAVEKNPGDATLAALAAGLLRDYPQYVGRTNAADEADQIIERLVKAAPDSDEALIRRYEYRRRYLQATDARQDLETVLQRSPRNPEALYLIANDEIDHSDSGQLAAAQQNLSKFCELQPADPRGPLSLARLYMAQNQPAQAIETLTNAHQRVETNSIEVTLRLAELLINANRLDEAERALSDFDAQMLASLSEYDTDTRIRLENVQRLLHARMEIGRRDFDQAARTLSAVVASTSGADIAAGATERLQAHALLAEVLGKLGRVDLAAAHWKAVASELNISPEANLRSEATRDAAARAAAAFLDLGRPGEAIDVLDKYADRGTAPAEVYILLVQAHLQQQLRLKTPNWIEFNKILNEAKSKFPERWELELAEATQLQAAGTPAAKQQALELLHNLEQTKAADVADLWVRLVFLYQQMGAQEDALRVLARFDKSEPSISRRAAVRATLLAQQNRVDDAIQTLVTAAESSPAPERRDLQLAQTRILLTAGKLEEAQSLAERLINDAPRERTALMLGIDIALLRRDVAAALRWEEQLKTLSGSDDFDWQYCRARRLLLEYPKLDAAAKAELATLVDGLRSLRPDWYPVAALAGQFAELSGNPQQAIQAYRLAYDLGDRRPEILERLLLALYRAGQANEAAALLERWKVEQPQNDRLESIGIAVAAKGQGLEAALALAKAAVARGSEDPMHYIWLANLLTLNRQPAEAEAVFRDSIKRFPHDDRVWSTFITYLARTRQTQAAQQAIDQWKRTAENLGPKKHYLLAQWYEQLGDQTGAIEQYRATIADDSKNIDAKLRLGKLLLASDTSAARREFEQVLQLDAKNAEARRSLAALLAATGGEADWQRAMQILGTEQQSGTAQESIANDRLRALLLARRGRNRNERLESLTAARQILETRLGQGDAASIDLDRLILAGILEQEAEIRGTLDPVLSARDVLRPLVTRRPVSAEMLGTYIELLLRHVVGPRAGSSSGPGEGELRDSLIDDASLRITDLAEVLGKTPTADGRFLLLSLRTRLLVAQGNSTEGRKQLNEFADHELTTTTNDADQAKMLLQMGNLATTLGFPEDAEKWYRQLQKIAPKSYVLLAKTLSDQQKTTEAIDLCLHVAPDRPVGEVATVLAQLPATSLGNKDLEQRVEATLQAALEADQNNIELLMSLAVRSVTRDDYDEAIRLFRRVLELQPNHAMALNNLATLLSERPNELVEARQFVQRAMAVSGRNPALLDTLGTIELRAGNAKQAILDLEESTAGTAQDPRYFFHLATAYQRAGRDQDALTALATAKNFGLDQAILTAGDRELLTSLEQQLKRDAEEKK